MSGNLVLLTGAGVSAESGLGTFRDKDGLWTRYDLAEVATPEGYAANPAKVLDFYNARRRNCVEAQPNAAHEAIARLAAQWPGTLTLVTQNIDDLHERAGSPEVVHMHGEILSALCATCAHRWTWAGAMSTGDCCPRCRATTVRPDIVWFGEIPYHMDRIGSALSQADIFVAIGTSGQVYPAAGFVAEARANGALTVEVNLEPSDIAGQFDRHVIGPASETLPPFVDDLLTARLTA